MSDIPNISEIRDLQKHLDKWVSRTPVLRCPAIEKRLHGRTSVTAKLEFLQRTGTFKARGALAGVLSLDRDSLQKGVTAVSAGNHAIATAFAAKVGGTSAKVVMTRTANPARVAACRDYGAEIVIADDVHDAFRQVDVIQRDEGRVLIHPFDGPAIARGAGTLGLEICDQVPDMEVLVVPVGGGGLISGVANAVKQAKPDVEIVGVEPEGADSMRRSIDSGTPQAIDTVRTIADSLGAPFALTYSFELARTNVDRFLLVSDPQLRRAMGMLFAEMKLAVEPACAATTAAALGPLSADLAGRNSVLLMCGSNMDWHSFSDWVDFFDAA